MSLSNNRIIKSLLTEFLYNGHLQSLGVIGIVIASTTISLNRLPTLDLLIVVYCIFQFIFVYDRYKHLEFDGSTNKTRTEHLKKHYSKIPYMLLLLSIVGVLLIFMFSNLTTLVISVSIVLLGVLYTFRVKQITKRLFMFKNLYVSIVFAIMVLYPFLYYQISTPANTTLVYLMALVFIESMANQIVLDIKDIKSDKKTGLLTVPARFGKDHTLRLVKYTSILLEILLLYFAVSIGADVILILLILLNMMVNQLLLRYMFRNNKMGYILAAGKFFVWLLLLLMLQFIK